MEKELPKGWRDGEEATATKKQGLRGLWLLSRYYYWRYSQLPKTQTLALPTSKKITTASRLGASSGGDSFDNDDDDDTLWTFGSPCQDPTGQYFRRVSPETLSLHNNYYTAFLLMKILISNQSGSDRSRWEATFFFSWRILAIGCNVFSQKYSPKIQKTILKNHHVPTILFKYVARIKKGFHYFFYFHSWPIAKNG
jgi:hypothetical protein